MTKLEAIPYGDMLFQRLREAPTRKNLRDAAQLALQVEFATIPVYLTGLYSISDVTSKPYQLLRSVVIEEMFHINQAANLVVALGGVPQFTGAAVPVYPGYLPKSNPDVTPLLGLYCASPGVFNDIYAGIETPAAHDAVPQGENYNTIAQFYKAFEDAIAAAEGNPFAEGSPEGLQRTDIYIGKFGGTPIEVTDKKSAYEGIHQIVRQGEGSVPPTGMLDATEPYGAYQYYGDRTDGTYGPILGTPYELSHFIKFRQVAVSSAPFPPTYPITSNPQPEHYSNKAAKALSDNFDLFYSMMLHFMEQTFRKGGEDAFFGPVLTIMHHILPVLANKMVGTPIFSGGDASAGPTAAPAWRWRADWKNVDLEAEMDRVEDGINAERELAKSLNILPAVDLGKELAPLFSVRAMARERLRAPLLALGGPKLTAHPGNPG